MLKVLSKKDFEELQILITLKERTEKFNELFEANIFKSGLWLEYWENQVISFKFHVLCGIVTIYNGDFSNQFNEEELKLYFNSAIHLEDLFRYVNDDISLEVLNTLPSESPVISEIWKHDINRTYVFDSIFDKEDPIFSNYCEFRLQNAEIIRSLPQSWGVGAELKFRYLNSTDIDDKIYWTNLCILKLYVTRKYQNRNQKC